MHMPSDEQLKAWADSYLKGTISESDKASLEAWYATVENTDVAWDEPGMDAHALQSRILKAVDHRVTASPARRYHLGWWASAAAAVVAVLVVMHYNQTPAAPPQPAVAAIQPADVPPGGTKATLLLADGKKMELNGKHALNVTSVKGTVRVLNKDGGVAYEGNTAPVGQYNTVITHRGEQSPPLTLPDGTKVWLNAFSTLRFPVSFHQGGREVVLTGEAYFEVAKDQVHPFIVHAGPTTVQVLGTHFDVKVYDDEPIKYTTLLEGAVRVSAAGRDVKLAPGQQSKANAAGALQVTKVRTPDDYIAWMYRQLPLNSMDIKSFLREVARWYDVEVVFEGAPPALSFSGTLSRDVPISKILAALNANGIHCFLRGKQLVIKG